MKKRNGIDYWGEGMAGWLELWSSSHIALFAISIFSNGGSGSNLACVVPLAVAEQNLCLMLQKHLIG